MRGYKRRVEEEGSGEGSAEGWGCGVGVDSVPPMLIPLVRTVSRGKGVEIEEKAEEKLEEKVREEEEEEEEEEEMEEMGLGIMYYVIGGGSVSKATHLFPTGLSCLLSSAPIDEVSPPACVRCKLPIPPPSGEARG